MPRPFHPEVVRHVADGPGDSPPPLGDAMTSPILPKCGSGSGMDRGKWLGKWIGGLNESPWTPTRRVLASSAAGLQAGSSAVRSDRTPTCARRCS
eukprot:gene17560-biopygen816